MTEHKKNIINDGPLLIEKTQIQKKFLDMYMKCFFLFESPYCDVRGIDKFETYFDKAFTDKLNDIWSRFVHVTLIDELIDELILLYTDFIYWDILYQRLRYGCNFLEYHGFKREAAKDAKKINTFVKQLEINLTTIFPTFSPTTVTELIMARQIIEATSKHSPNEIVKSEDIVQAQIINTMGENNICDTLNNTKNKV
jgi:hypothetical protein